jgi:hypothetical protein
LFAKQKAEVFAFFLEHLALSEFNRNGFSPVQRHNRVGARKNEVQRAREELKKSWNPKPHKLQPLINNFEFNQFSESKNLLEV